MKLFVNDNRNQFDCELKQHAKQANFDWLCFLCLYLSMYRLNKR